MTPDERQERIEEIESTVATKELVAEYLGLAYCASPSEVTEALAGENAAEILLNGIANRSFVYWVADEIARVAGLDPRVD